MPIKIVTKTPYEVLKVDRNASIEEIRENYKALAVVYHPDRNVGNARAKQKFSEITEAYQMIKQVWEKKKRREELFAA